MKLRIGMHLKLYKNGKTVVDTTMRVKYRVAELAQVGFYKKTCDSGWLRVTYKRGVHNEVEFDNFDDFRKALTCFTEQNLIKYLST